ncbi:phosphonopyruvate decarboxylase [Bradyrhizobium sp. CCBAU 051011]|uniref:phosphonopyruvate decarboxylase n=1 Tax=Bradyrhizobium sp. CCBAU 051011 TaxID=858422 RepID=UPI001FEDD4FA|nr:phosphonopyruvate decarboxylase [Bradyrhizobium sp. CCBAU 051011]
MLTAATAARCPARGKISPVGRESKMTMSTTTLLGLLKQQKYEFFSGVPCSNFADLFQQVALDKDITSVPASNEGSALSFAVGATLAGQRSVVALQNSGLGNIINPLTSLVQINCIPTLLLVSVRGLTDEPEDEPQHRIMGANTHALLDQLAIPWSEFDGTPQGFMATLRKAEEAFERSVSFAILVRKGQLSAGLGVVANGEQQVERYPLSVGCALEIISEALRPTDLVVSTTGFISRELFRVSDRPENFYMQGSLGHCSAVAAGVALAHPSRRVVALDGDGAVLMHMGVLSTIGYASPRNFLHVVLDNEGYVSTGKQDSTSVTSSLEAVAAACGYRAVCRCVTGAELGEAVARSLSTEGPHFLLCKVNQSHSRSLPRVTSRHSPEENKEAFQIALNQAEAFDLQAVPAGVAG